MLLSGSSYLTRDLYRPLTGRGDASDEETDRREALVARVGVVVFATLSFVASLYTPGTLVQIGDTAFSGFAQLTVPVAHRVLAGNDAFGDVAGVVESGVLGLHVVPVLSTVEGCSVSTLPCRRRTSTGRRALRALGGTGRVRPRLVAAVDENTRLRRRKDERSATDLTDNQPDGGHRRTCKPTKASVQYTGMDSDKNVASILLDTQSL